MPSTDFASVFFKSAANRIRDRYGADSYIDASDEQIAIRGRRGQLLGAGLTLREAMRDADTRKGTTEHSRSVENEQATVTTSPKLEAVTCSAPRHVHT